MSFGLCFFFANAFQEEQSKFVSLCNEASYWYKKNLISYQTCVNNTIKCVELLSIALFGFL